MERCETCKHWKFDKPDWEFDELHFGECKAMKMRDEIVREALAEAEIDSQYDEGGEEVAKRALAATKAIPVDGSGYYAGLRTAPDFGCVLHTPADDRPDDRPA